MMEFILFTGKNCRACPGMKLNMVKAGIKYDEVSTDTDKGKMMAGTMHVRSLPTLILTLQNKPVQSFVGQIPVDALEEIKKKYKGG